MEQSIQFGSKLIEFRLEFAKRKTLGITVTPELEVFVRAPEGASLDKIHALVRKRAPWILKQQSFFLGFYPKQPPKRFISGETHLYLGRQYRLKIHQGKPEMVKLSGRYIHVFCQKESSPGELLKAWYLSHARVKLRQYTEEWIEYFRKYNVQPSSLVLLEMPKRWGSCTAKRRIILNPELIKAPRGCIDYVIIHELCHLVHHNHNQKFIDLQTKVMPDWETWKDRLERFLA